MMEYNSFSLKTRVPLIDKTRFQLDKKNKFRNLLLYSTVTTVSDYKLTYC